MYQVGLRGPESADHEAIFRHQVENPRKTRFTKQPSLEPTKWARVSQRGAIIVTKNRQRPKRIIIRRWERIGRGPMDRVTVEGSSPSKDHVVPRKSRVLRRIAIRVTINGLDLKRSHVASLIGARRATNNARRVFGDLTLRLEV